MKETLNVGLTEAKRKKVAEGLIKLLANNYVLYLKTHNFHWNVVGSMFQPLHSLFEEQYIDLWNAGDTIAERVRALGFRVPASYADFEKLSKIKEVVGTRPIKAKDMISQLVHDQEVMIRLARELLPEVEEVDDQVSVDLLSERMQVHEKNAWMLRSFLE
ncbi:DNA starvation/stationary phase protection protein [Rickettsiella grylli]|uniref:Dps family protein n=1 Tax=Rickettsiella grylli TaxID=59196 RepID=UPI0008FCFAC1|nr:Dps family protein [Rickettsiella grylli]OIZ99857.1 DNA starvation/stationary phase protection protein [Rickettsiella grylli]